MPGREWDELYKLVLFYYQTGFWGFSMVFERSVDGFSGLVEQPGLLV
jgi:hypothetical protein